ncbi:MAG: hypothetical protein SGILL_004452 [Bacillariaceae sp.]
MVRNMASFRPESNNLKRVSGPIYVTETTKFRRATGNSFHGAMDPGCGFSLRVGVTDDEDIYEIYNRNLAENGNVTKPPVALAFFKAQVGSHPYFHFGEWHLREIVASHLDDLLGTDVVPPCIGFRMPLDTVMNEYPQAREQAKCILIKPPTEDDGRKLKRNKRKKSTKKTKKEKKGQETPPPLPPTIGGSLMKWSSGTVSVVKPQKILYHAAFASHTNTTLSESATRYVIFLYLAGCVKTSHNHFLETIEGVNGEAPQSTYLAIDNDRCMIPRRAFMIEESKKAYKKGAERTKKLARLVLENLPCGNYPPKVAERVLAMSAANPAYGSVQNGVSTSLGSTLKTSLKKDALADEILSFQPETFDELDERVELLADRLRECGFQ